MGNGESGLPVVALAEAGDMGRMVLAVPGVHPEQEPERHLAVVFGMHYGAGLQRFAIEVFDAGIPTGMQGVQQGERNIYRQLVHIIQFGPGGFIIGFDGGIVFGHAQLEADHGIGMAVCNMMDHLLDRPAPVAVWREQLGFIQVQDRILQQLWKEFNIIQPILMLLC